MSPEVGLGQPYNETCDVFSFAILLWEIFSLETPYGKKVFSSPSHFQKHVWIKGKRPSDQRRAFLPWWSSTIDRLLEDCWSNNVEDRYSMEKVEAILSKEDFEESYTKPGSNIAPNSNNKVKSPFGKNLQPKMGKPRRCSTQT